MAIFLIKSQDFRCDIKRFQNPDVYRSVLQQSSRKREILGLGLKNAVSSELGYRFQNQKILAKISGFMRNTTNGIDWQRNFIGSLKAVNIAKIDLKGFETEFRHQPFAFLNYRLAYTYLDNKYRDEMKYSRFSLQNLKHQFVAQLDLRFLKFFSNQLIYKYSERVNLGSYNILDEQL